MIVSRTMILMIGIAALGPSRANAAGSAAKSVEKPVKTLIQAIRYGKDNLGVRSLAGESQGRFLLGKSWEVVTPEQRQEFVRLFHALLAGIAFPKVRADFEKLETILYDTPKAKGNTAQVGSTIVILHPLKKQEIKAVYRLVEEDKSWKVLDVSIIGDKSMLTNIRDDQVGPILKEGGINLLLKSMRERLKEVQSQKPSSRR